MQAGRGSPSALFLKSVAERMEATRQELGATRAAGGIIELKGRDGFSKDGQGGDPKIALRKGAAMAGRVTQFITPPKTGDGSVEEGDGDIKHRARAAWLDLLRQLGVTAGPLDLAPAGTALPGGLQYVGVWLLNLRKSSNRPAVRLPVMVRVPTGGGPVLARIGTPELPEWLPYAEAIRRLGSLSKIQFHGWGQDTVAHFVRDAVERDLLAEGPVMLMAEAQNLRLSWKWLQDGRLAPDMLQLPPGGPRVIGDWPGLRLIRLRVTAGGETPEAFGEDGETTGFPKGQWRWSERVFYSTANKPDAMNRLSPSQSRLRPYRTARRAHRAAPDKIAWNPSCLEITAAALQPGDDPMMWANLAHQLRFRAWHFDDPLTLPLPLHLALKLEEYALPIDI